MRLAKFVIEENELGIKPVKFIKRDFGPVVALVGTNGSGKSRILNLVKQYFLNLNTNQIQEGHVTHLPNGFPNGTNAASFQQFNLLRPRYIRELKLSSFLTSQPAQSNNNLGIQYGTLFTPAIQQSISNIYNNGQNEFNNINIDSIHAYVTNLALQISQAEAEAHLNNTRIDESIEQTRTHLNRFNELLQAMLGKSFNYTKHFRESRLRVETSFDSRQFVFETLSPGEKILYRYAAMLFVYEHVSQTNIHESILIIDEPETHLHPHFQIDLITRLRNLIADSGQLWIATHSLHILAHLDYENILMVKNGEVKSPSRKSHSLLFKELMKIESHIGEFRSFINSISEFHYANFIIECFNKPLVVGHTETTDPQYLQLKSKLSAIHDDNIDGQLKLLDFGAGAGRIGISLLEDSDAGNIEYSAYDIDQDSIQQIIKTGITDKAYSSLQDIPDAKYDFVVMCNVLHEIEPDHWIEVFSRIKACLKDDGFLLLLEHTELIRGENANQFGYLMLSYDEQKKLFEDSNLNQVRSELSNEESNNLSITAVPKSLIRVSSNSIINAIQALKANVFKAMKSIRDQEEYDELNARRYAHYSQLYINADMYLTEVAKKKGSTK